MQIDKFVSCATLLILNMINATFCDSNLPNEMKFIQIQAETRTQTQAEAQTKTQIKTKTHTESEYKNPDQVAGDSVGGDSGEFLRRNQPQEHIIIPLINILEAEYNPWFAPNIKKYRKELVKPDKGLKFMKKLNEELNKEVNKIVNKK
jgi:hypothetical protein